jgi:hypothetical protein
MEINKMIALDILNLMLDVIAKYPYHVMIAFFLLMLYFVFKPVKF